MTCDERIEALLNRAGQTISDLPRKEGTAVSEPYSTDQMLRANGAAWAWYMNEFITVDEGRRLEGRNVAQMYILHLTDVIDRMEEALDNLVRQRDWLRTKVCFVCWHINEDMPGPCDPEECANASIPEGWCADWRVDDGQ